MSFLNTLSTTFCQLGHISTLFIKNPLFTLSYEKLYKKKTSFQKFSEEKKKRLAFTLITNLKMFKKISFFFKHLKISY